MTKYTHVYMTKDCKEKLDFLSEKSCLPRSRILDLLITQIFDIASSFEFLNFDFDQSISKATLYVTMSGKRKMTIEKRVEVETND
ncbi:MAG: hypothetical protein JW702_08965 [Clostridiales bacterium]|nr:hypothetical protein [Clostridiales bacterium]